MSWSANVMRWLVIAIATLLTLYGFVIGVAAFRSADGVPITGFAFMLFAWFPVFFIHELGHAIAAELVGWRVWIFHVAPFVIRPRPFSLRFVGSMGGPDLGGFVLVLPRDACADTWLRSAWVSAGGPIASWLLATMCFAYSWWRQSTAPEFDNASWINGASLAIGAYSLAIALLSSWPMDRPKHGNDAAHILEKWRSKETQRIPESGAGLAHGLWAYGVPLASTEPWMREAVAKAADARPWHTEMLDAVLRGDEAQARLAIGRFVKAHPDSTDASVLRAFEAAWFDGDARRVDDALAATAGLDNDSDLFRIRQLALATLLRLEDDIEGAERVFDSIIRSANAYWGFSGSSWETLAQRAFSRPLPVRAQKENRSGSGEPLR